MGEQSQVQDQNQQQPQVDAYAGWKTYTDEQYGFEFRYPKDWNFKASETGGVYNFLDIHLSNIAPSDSPLCMDDFLGMEIQVGNKKETTQSFESFVRQRVLNTNVEGLGPRGEISQTQIGSNKFFKVQYSGWDGCSGPGYFIEQNSQYYTYVFSGAGEKEVANLKNVIENQILSIFKFTK